MISLYLSRCLLFSPLVLFLYAGYGNGHQAKCPSSFDCGKLGIIKFPFTISERQDCGILAIHGCDDHNLEADKSIEIRHRRRRMFNVKLVDQSPYSIISTIVVIDDHLNKSLMSRKCRAFSHNLSLPSSSPFAYFQIRNNITLFRCNRTLTLKDNNLKDYQHRRCPDYDVFYGHPNTDNSPSYELPKSLAACSTVQLPTNGKPDMKDVFRFLTAEIPIEVRLSDDCSHCYFHRGGQCQLDSRGKFYCAKENKSGILKLGLSLGLGAGFCIVVSSMLILRHYKIVQFPTRRPNGDPCSNSDPENGNVIFGVPIFCYKELEEATNNFDSTRQLGEGGFGTVYRGKLKDGREVAIKRLYEHNYRRVDQLMTEIGILTRLRHRNLVSLYGCTSRHSHELLLVYEYIPNGTVACHLHGNLAKHGFLSWSVRMKIALETATALACLHASNIIHCNVKTNNILLDNNFCVKVADFGLSRLLPYNVNYVYTAPQGILGYLDAEDYQTGLTSESDVYSFGIVLVELISSMPAIDTTRHRDEINLAHLAMNKIRKGEFWELVDPSLGFEPNNEVKRTIDSIAELAFQCLQQDKELRPSMDEVLAVLKRVEGEKNELEYLEEADERVAGMSNSCLHPLSPSPNCDEVGLLENSKLPSSPNTEIHRWENESTSPKING
ncbi:hypothetical protein L6164_001697 [Bauhinia variegata]|uniref:Uncharacterized protein n=1 Tax=Bauhinia variegata TaxID=167791 RepID=A0ACB9QHK2_BAUVA|nr:hypothetical protein L6164_001697 [Bauhinia variegata]